MPQNTIQNEEGPYAGQIRSSDGTARPAFDSVAFIPGASVASRRPSWSAHCCSSSRPTCDSEKTRPGRAFPLRRTFPQGCAILIFPKRLRGRRGGEVAISPGPWSAAAARGGHIRLALDGGVRLSFTTDHERVALPIPHSGCSRGIYEVRSGCGLVGPTQKLPLPELPGRRAACLRHTLLVTGGSALRKAAQSGFEQSPVVGPGDAMARAPDAGEVAFRNPQLLHGRPAFSWRAGGIPRGGKGSRVL